MRSLRSRLLAGAAATTTIAFAVGGLLVHQLARVRLEQETDRSLARVLDFAVRSAAVQARAFIEYAGRLNTELDFSASPTGRNDVFFVCRNSAGVLLDGSDELGEARAMIKMPEAALDEVRYADFVLADGSRARGAALAFFPAEPSDSSGMFPSASERVDDLGAGVSALDPETRELLRQVREGLRREAGPMRLIVLQSIEPREAALRDLAGILLLTWLLTCSVGGAALWLTIRRELRPLEQLRAQIEELDLSSDGDPVVVPGAPLELAPVVEQLEASRQRLAAAFRREQRFAGDAAHELRTPVSGIHAILEVALRRERSAEELRDYARQCLGIAAEMGRAVEALLMLGKLSRGEVALELDEVHLVDLVAEAWKPVEPLAVERDITLETALGEGRVSANAKLLMRALSNLIDNAVDYGDSPGAVRVRLTEVGERSVIEVSNPASDPPDGLAEHAFEPFWRGEFARTDAARHAGLGLALVQRIAELHGGEASLEAAEGRVVARLLLPIL